MRNFNASVRCIPHVPKSFVFWPGFWLHDDHLCSALLLESGDLYKKTVYPDRINGILSSSTGACVQDLGHDAIRNLNCRGSALRSPLVSVDLTADNTPATGSCRRFARQAWLRHQMLPASRISVTMPPPRQLSPLYSTALCPGVTARWGVSARIISCPSCRVTSAG